MSLTREKDVWEPISVQHYGQSLRLLTDELWAEGANRDIILTATILLCSHDVLAFPDADYQRLLYGGRTLIEADFDAIDTSDLSRASFWIYARQDVSLALENERPTLIPPKEWPAVPSPEETQEDALARRMLWLLARVIEVRFDGRSDADGKEQDELIFDLTSELFDWSMSIPGHANGVEVEDDLDLADDLEQTWFCVPSSAAGYLYSHLADILRLEFWRSRPTSPISDDLLDAALSGHALKIASICLSPGVSDGVLTVAVDPLFYAAKHCESLSLKARIWALLEDIERRLGIHTRNKVSRL
ncbi:hypothetical protein CEP51_002441 [Fusarium floridanum]|uniref:Transcription factor domain-containing protein n=1 Tax=Fusarium floridanum TaxID=1325733 RepID=A0A428SBE4_9HYPO|nr:hypothetical protein CEP51_002441 [Fusarium floridanum]